MYLTKSKFVFTTILFFIVSADAGAVLLIEAPQAIKLFLNKAQTMVQTCIEQINNQSNGQYAFEHSHYAPHITLAFISNEKFSMDQLKEKNPQLIEHLNELRHRDAIDMTSAIKDMYLEVWQGKKERIYEGIAYKNYSIIVIKINESTQLMNLVQDIDEILKKQINTYVRDFPFSAHLTIGWVYNKNIDQNLVIKQIKPLIEKLITEFKINQGFVIESISLSTADKEQIVFSFNK